MRGHADQNGIAEVGASLASAAASILTCGATRRYTNGSRVQASFEKGRILIRSTLEERAMEVLFSGSTAFMYVQRLNR